MFKQIFKMVSKFISLPGGMKMPIVGFGTWQATDSELEDAVEKALEAGYRHIDTAFAYENEHVIGRVLKRWISSGRLTRRDLFIVTKLPPCGNRPESVEKYMKQSLKNLELEYVDQYLVHTPFAFVEVEGNLHPTDANGDIRTEIKTDLVAVWKAMEKQVDAGRALTIGLSNFNEKQMDRVLGSARIKPVTLQVEIHLYLQQKALVDYCKKHGMSVTAYSPLGSKGFQEIMSKSGSDKKVSDLMDNPVVKDIASKHAKSPAQVLLRHTIQRGICVIPKSTNSERLRMNISIFDFSLDEDDIQKMDSLDKGLRVCDFSFFKGIQKSEEFPF